MKAAEKTYEQESMERIINDPEFLLHTKAMAKKYGQKHTHEFHVFYAFGYIEGMNYAIKECVEELGVKK